MGFETTISAGEGPQFYALDRAATAIGELASLMSANTKDLDSTFATMSAVPLLF